MAENLDNDQINRLWDYKQHLDNVFYTRLNTFMVFESVLLGTFGLLDSRPNPPLLMLRVLAILGLCFTIVWIYAQYRQMIIIDDIKAYASEVMPWYKAASERREKLRWPHFKAWPLSSI